MRRRRLHVLLARPDPGVRRARVDEQRVRRRGRADAHRRRVGDRRVRHADRDRLARGRVACGRGARHGRLGSAASRGVGVAAGRMVVVMVVVTPAMRRDLGPMTRAEVVHVETRTLLVARDDVGELELVARLAVLELHTEGDCYGRHVRRGSWSLASSRRERGKKSGEEGPYGDEQSRA